MADFNKIKSYLNGASDKTGKSKKSSGIGWEIGAYTIRGVSVGTPAVVIMCMENSWVKTGIGLLATLLIIAMVIIYKEPLKKAMGYAPGVVPFTIFVVVALFFNTAANALMTIGISGLGGSVAAIPLHMKYLSMQQQEKTPEQQTLERIADSLEKLK